MPFAGALFGLYLGDYNEFTYAHRLKLIAKKVWINGTLLDNYDVINGEDFYMENEDSEIKIKLADDIVAMKKITGKKYIFVNEIICTLSKFYHGYHDYELCYVHNYKIKIGNPMDCPYMIYIGYIGPINISEDECLSVIKPKTLAELDNWRQELLDQNRIPITSKLCLAG